MVRSMADVLREEGRREEQVRSRQDLLLMLLHERFGKVPKVLERTVRATEDVDALTDWLRRAATVKTLQEVGIQTKR